jgi:cytochrome P450
MRPRVQRVADALLDRAAERGRMEVVRDFARALPASIICHILGVPPEDRDRFQRWVRDYAVLVGGVEVSAAQAEHHVAGVRAFAEYFGRLVDRRRREPQDDLLQALIDAEREGLLSREELFANYVLLATGGHLTTAGLIANGLFTLLRHPEERTKLAQNPTFIKPAIEEMLRFESPIQAAGRRAVEDVEIGGKRIQAGQFVRLHLGAANRDPDQFARPGEFDITRADNRHLAFNLGPHFCVGAALGRLEGQIAVGRLLERFPDVRLGGEAPQWRMDIISRGLKSLNVILR